MFLETRPIYLGNCSEVWVPIGQGHRPRLDEPDARDHQKTEN